MAAASGDQRDLLALIHQHLVQIGYGKAARALLLQSGQKNFPPSPVLLRDIFTQWKKTSLESQKQSADDHKRDALAKIRVPDPESSSESEEEEEVAKPTTNLSVNNRSTAKAESSSEDEDSSSEEEAVTEKTVKTPVAGNKAANLLQLAAQKSNSVPGKGVAVAAVQAKGKASKAVSSKQPLPAVATTKQQNKALPGKPGPLTLAGKSSAQAAAAKKASSSESSSSGSSESEEEKTPTVVKTPASTQALEKAESSSEDSSDDSEEEPTNTAAVQVKQAVHNTQINTTSAKSSQATAVLSKASPAQATANQTRAGLGSAAGRAKPAESSETSDSSDSEDENPVTVVQANLLGKTSQAFTSPVKNAPSVMLSKKAVHTPLKQAAKPAGTGLRKPGLLPPTKTAESAKETESSEESSSESETSPVPISQKWLQTPQPPTSGRQGQADKPGLPVKAASSALKGKESESSSSSDSEDEMPNLPPTPTTKTNAKSVLTGAKKLQPSSTSLQKAQESEDSSEDSSDESSSEEDTAFTQKPAQVAQKPGVVPAKTPAVKTAGEKMGNVQSEGKGTTELAAASLQKEPESLETDNSDSSESEEDGKQVKQPPSHPFLKQQTPSGNAATASGTASQINSTVSDSVSSKRQGKGPAMKVVPSSFKKAKPVPGQVQPAKNAGNLDSKESSASSSSSDSEEVEVASLRTAKRIAQSAGILKKQGAIKKAESSSEESHDEDPEPSQSLLTGYSSLLNIPKPAGPKNASSTLSKQTCGKATATTATPVIAAIAKSSEKAPLHDSSSSDSSDSETEAEETSAVHKPEVGLLPSSGRDAVVEKSAVGIKAVSGSISSLVPPAKKARKAQSNGRAKGATAKPIQMVSPEEIGSKSEEAMTQVSNAGAQVDTPASLNAATKARKTPKASKAGAIKKTPKKRKLAGGDTGLGKPAGKKLKVQGGVEAPKKKKKKSKSSSSTSTPKKKEGKDKKSNKKKKKNKELKSPTSNVSQKKKKKKKTGDVESAA